MVVQNIIKEYAEAAVPNPVSILGVRLRNFSLGHVILMKKYDLPWVSDKEESPSIWALIFGIFICSQSWSEFEAWMKEENEWEKFENCKPIHPFKYRLSNFLKKHYWFFRFECLRNYYYDKWENDIRDFTNRLSKEVDKADSFNIMEKIAEFAKYIRAGSRTPRFFVKPGKGDQVGETNKDAWIENTLVTLVSKMNYTREEALNAPLCQAIFDYLKYSEENDVITFGDSYDRIEENLRINEELRKKQYANS